MKKYLYLILFFLVCVPAIAGTINSYTLKSPPDSADTFVIYDSDDGSTKKAQIGDISGSSSAGINWTAYTDLTSLANGNEFIVNDSGTSKSINWEVFQTQISAGGWTDAGTFISTTTSTDLVGVGTTAPIHGDVAKLNIFSNSAPTDETSYPAFDLGYGLFNYYEYAPDSNDVIWGLAGKVKNTGSSGSIGHMIGVAGQASDTSAGLQALAGVEGRVDVFGNADHYGGVLGLVSTLDNTSYTGDIYGVYTGFTGSNSGQVIAFKAPDVSTGIRQYSFWGEDNMVLYPNGNVGIGTFIPINKLQVGGISSVTYTPTASKAIAASVFNNSTTDNTYTNYLTGQTNANNALAVTGSIAGIQTSHTAGAESADWAIINKDSGTFQENVRILSGGNTGIGTVSPRQKLEVSGTIRATSFMSSDGSAGVTGSSCTAWKNGLCTSL